MYKDKKIIALVPARGGSKRVPGKNIRPLLGRPLIAWTIREAKKSAYIDDIVVSTDDAAIADVSRRFGVKVPFLRPKGLAKEGSKAIDAVLHAIKSLKERGKSYDALVLLQPTSPLRVKEDIERGIEKLFEKKAYSVVSVCACEHHPYWTNKLPSDGSMKRFLRPAVVHLNSQDLPVFYRLNGAVFVARTDHILGSKSFFGKKAYAHVMPQERSIDIDTEFDFAIGELMLKKRLKKNGRRNER